MRGTTLRPISAGSMSTWMVQAAGSGRKVGLQLVSCSSKRAPSASTTSASGSSFLVSQVRWWPMPPAASGWSSGRLPLPASVVITGAPSASASWRTSIQAPEAMAPPPARISGLLAAARASLAARTASGQPRVRGGAPTGV